MGEGAGPRRKVQLARLAGGPALRKVPYERRDGLGGEWLAKELGLVVGMPIGPVVAGAQLPR